MAPRPRTPPNPTLPAESLCPARPESHSELPQPTLHDPQPWFPRLFYPQRWNNCKGTESRSRTRIFSWFLVTQKLSGIWYLDCKRSAAVVSVLVGVLRKCLRAEALKTT